MGLNYVVSIGFLDKKKVELNELLKNIQFKVEAGDYSFDLVECTADGINGFEDHK